MCAVRRENYSIQASVLISVRFWPCNLIWIGSRPLLAPGRCIFSSPILCGTRALFSFCIIICRVKLTWCFILTPFRTSFLVTFAWIVLRERRCPCLLMFLANSTDKVSCLALCSKLLFKFDKFDFGRGLLFLLGRDRMLLLKRYSYWPSVVLLPYLFILLVNPERPVGLLLKKVLWFSQFPAKACAVVWPLCGHIWRFMGALLILL